MTIELKVQEGLVIRPTNPQLYALIQEPLRKRAERLSLTLEEIGHRTGLSPTAVNLYCGTGRRTAEVGVRVSTLVKLLDAVDHPITEHNFNVILSVGGGMLKEAIHNGIPQLRAWRKVESFLDEAGQVRAIEEQRAARQEQLNATALALSASEAGTEPEPILSTPPERTVALEDLTAPPTVIEIAADALQDIPPATLAQYARCGIQVRIVR